MKNVLWRKYFKGLIRLKLEYGLNRRSIISGFMERIYNEDPFISSTDKNNSLKYY
jgi:hypothetical protein